MIIARRKKAFFCAILLLVIIAAGAGSAQALQIPTINIALEEAEKPEQVATVIKILFLLTVLTLAPSILIMMT
ncbi:MAG: flagellar biosynthetic protein FliP, partial [Deltaproteobacteria bacterium]|nr:flagellar biosynthetic protein FliP [Deltaproteobacteria bacterium]